MKASFFHHFLLLIIVVIAAYTTNTVKSNASRSSIIGYGGMVGSAHHLATDAGLEILRNGGTAADAALAVQMALNVVQPHMSGIGGGVFILYYDYQHNQTVYAIDGREEAPEAYHGKIFCRNPDCLSDAHCSDCSDIADTASFAEKRVGGLSVGVPGTLYAFYNLYKYFGGGRAEDGQLAWSDLLEPAVQLSLQGFPMYEELYEELISNREYMARSNASFDLYFDARTNLPKANVSELVTNSDFAHLLQHFQTLGANGSVDYFYSGELARDLVNTVRTSFAQWQYKNTTVSRPGLMSLNDLRGYRAVFREVVESTFGGDTDDDAHYRMYGMNMPSSGGVTVQYLMTLMYSLIQKPELQHLNISDLVSQSDTSTVDNIHWMVAANNVAFSDRNQYMADSDFVNVPVNGLLDFEYIYSQRATSSYFQLNYTSTPIAYGEPSQADEDNLHRQTSMVQAEHGTSHFFVVDQWNNMAVVTTTIESHFGSCVTVPGFGFTLNNELTDFDALGTTVDNLTVANGPEGGKKLRRTALDIFGLNDSTTFGGKRPRSSMAPTIVLDAETKAPILSVGSPGGSSIIATTFQTLFNMIVRKWDVQRSIDAYRVWSFNEDTIQVEPQIWNENEMLAQQLVAKGYELRQFINRTRGTCAAVQFEPIIHCRGLENFYILYGGADDLRLSTASTKAICAGDGTNSVDSEDEFCVQKSNICASNARQIERWSIALIAGLIFLVVLCILCAIVNRKRIKNKIQTMRSRNTEYSLVDPNSDNNQRYTSDENLPL